MKLGLHKYLFTCLMNGWKNVAGLWGFYGDPRIIPDWAVQDRQLDLFQKLQPCLRHPYPWLLGASSGLCVGEGLWPLSVLWEGSYSFPLQTSLFI